MSMAHRMQLDTGKRKALGGRLRGLVHAGERRLDGRADGVEDAADLGAQEDQRDDRDDRDEGEDQRVLGEALAVVVVADGRDKCMKLRHVGSYLLPLIYLPKG